MKYDVVVVGAGPSGSTAAKNLSEYGISVLLIDKDKFPRNKPCGGGVPMRTITRFPYLKDLSSIDSFSYGGFVYSQKNTGKTKILKTSPVLSNVLRSRFDQDLVNVAIDKGTEFQDNKKVTSIKINSDHVQLIFKDGSSLNTNLVIGADGTYSSIAKQAGLSENNDRTKGLCVLEEFPLTEKEMDEYFTSDRLCHIHSKFHGIRGYGWVFPKKNHVNVGIISYDYCLTSDARINLNHIFKEYIDHLKKENILPHSIQINHPQGGVLPYQPHEKTYSERLLLCGDAAGLINPISGEGIYYALVSGKIAATIASEAINQQNTSEEFLSSYQRAWKKDFGKDIYLFLKSKNQWGKSGDKIIRMMNKDQKFAEMIFLIMVGKVGVQDMKWRLLKRYLYNVFF